MPRNKLLDLNNHLFECIERLNDDNVVGKDLNGEINRSKAVCEISSQIVSVHRLALDGAKLKLNNQGKVSDSFLSLSPVANEEE